MKRFWPYRRNLHGPAQSLGMVATISVIPLYMMWNVLFVNPTSHLSNPGVLPGASTVTDLDGAARLVYLLSDMGTPWSNTQLISSPTGSSIWRLESLTQMIQVLFLWLASQFAQPMFAVNLFVLFGWILTGLATYFLARHFGCNRPMALVSVVLVQLAPSMRFMAANFTSYVFVAVPLLTIYAAIKFFQELHWSKFSVLLLSLVFTGIFDPYWFFYSLLNCTVIGVYYIARELVHEKSKRSIGFLGAGVGLCTVFFIVARVLSTQVAESALDRPIAIASKSDVENSVMNLVHWTSSHYTGIGYLLPILFLLSIFLSVVILRNSVGVILVVALVMIMLSSRITIPFLDSELILARQVRFIMPGVRFFDRAALIALPLVLIVIGKTLQDVGEKLPLRKFVPFLAPVILLVSVFTYPSITRPNSTQSYKDWSEIREQLNLDNSQRVLALPFTRRGRDWIEQASFQKPLVNDFVETVNNQQVILHASNGPSALAAYLASIGVSHVFSIDQELARFFDYKLEAPRFVPIGEIVLNGFGEGADYELTVYKVVLQKTDSLCTNCKLGPHVVTEVRVTGDLVYPPEVSSEGFSRWWIGDKRSRISFASMSQPVSVGSENRKIQLRFSIAPCASKVVVRLKYVEFQTQIELNQSAPNKTVEIPISDSTMSDVEIVALGATCRFESDPRQILVQLSDVRLS